MSSNVLDLNKTQTILNALQQQPTNIVVDNILFSDASLVKPKRVVCYIASDTPPGALFDIFERTWSAVQTQKLLKDVKNEIILEFGCGDLRMFEHFKNLRFYPNFIGVDIRSDHLNQSKTKNRKEVLAICADISKGIPLKDEATSVIITNEVIEHITYEQNILFFKEAYRLLKPGGVILLASPINTRDRKFHTVENEKKSLGHIFFWDAEDLEKELLAIGFSNVHKQWGMSTSSAIKIAELKKSMHPEVQKFIETISSMYGSQVARAIALSDPSIVNGGCRFIITK